jgi:hypothetical protein
MKRNGSKLVLTYRYLNAVAIAALTLLLGTSGRQAGASFILGDAVEFGVLYEGKTNQTLSFNNGTLIGNIGIGQNAMGKFQGNGPGTINGFIEFSDTNMGQFSNNGLTLNPATGNPEYSMLDVESALNTVNSLSESLGLETGTGVALTNGGSVTLGSGPYPGTVDGSGNYVYTITNLSGFSANTTFTVTGTASEYAVFNIPGSVGNNGMDGVILLSGGITADHVLFNWTPDPSNLTNYDNDYTNLSGGPTMTISTNYSGNGTMSHGDFLDPTGNFQANNCYIDGRIMGGDSQNSSLVSGANLDAPPVPEPSTLALLGAGVISLLAYAWRKRRAA